MVEEAAAMDTVERSEISFRVNAEKTYLLRPRDGMGWPDSTPGCIFMLMKRRYVVMLPIAVIVITAVAFVIFRNRAVAETDVAPKEISSQYSESPMLRERVERGELPPVEERLPDNPLVVTPIEQIGRYDSEPKESASEPAADGTQ